MKKLKDILNRLANKDVRKEKVNKVDIKDCSRETVELHAILNNNLMF